jgi:hypothetical protein
MNIIKILHNPDDETICEVRILVYHSRHNFLRRMAEMEWQGNAEILDTRYLTSSVYWDCQIQKEIINEKKMVGRIKQKNFHMLHSVCVSFVGFKDIRECVTKTINNIMPRQYLSLPTTCSDFQEPSSEGRPLNKLLPRFTAILQQISWLYLVF